MNYRAVLRYMGQVLSIEGLFMLPALLISLYRNERNSVYGFCSAIVITLAAAVILAVLCRRAKKGFYARDGLVCVGASWIVMSLLGCLPFYFSGEIPH